MRLGRHTDSTRPGTAEASAAGLFASWERLDSRKRTFALGLICTLAVTLSLATSFALAAPDVPLTGDARTQIDSLDAQAEELQAQILVLDQQLETATETYNMLVVQLDELNVTMMSLRQEQDTAQQDYQYRLRLYEERLRDLYKDGGRDKLLEMVLEATDADDFVERARLASELAAQDRRLMENLSSASDRLETVIAEIDDTKGQQLVIREQAEAERERVQATLADRQATLDGVGTQITEIMEAERARQAEEQAQLQQALASMINGGEIYTGTLPQTDNEILNQFLQTAAAYLGIEYVWGGDRPSTGMDCSGYTRYVFKQHGVTLPHYSGYQAIMGSPVNISDIMAGDLLAFGSPVYHVGIYIGDGMFLHAAGTGLGVRVGTLSSRSDLSAIRRFPLKARTGDPLFD